MKLAISVWAGLLLAAFALPAVVPERAAAQCIDEAIRDELNARRRYRGVQRRLFLKAGRHELSPFGGWYSADLLSSAPIVGGAYTFHVSEDLALEASFSYTRADSKLIRIIENDRGITLIRVDAPVYIYAAHLIWNLAYGKMRWFGGPTSRFDFYLALGGGITDNQTARGLTFSGGLGLKFYPASWFAFRVDLRDQLLEQEVLGESTLVNNILLLGGFSVFIPFGF